MNIKQIKKEDYFYTSRYIYITLTQPISICTESRKGNNKVSIFCIKNTCTILYYNDSFTRTFTLSFKFTFTSACIRHLILFASLKIEAKCRAARPFCQQEINHIINIFH